MCIYTRQWSCKVKLYSYPPFYVTFSSLPVFFLSLTCRHTYTKTPPQASITMKKVFIHQRIFFSFLKINSWGNRFKNALCFGAQHSIRSASSVQPLGLVRFCLKSAMLTAIGQKGLHNWSCFIYTETQIGWNKLDHSSVTWSSSPPQFNWACKWIIATY